VDATLTLEEPRALYLQRWKAARKANDSYVKGGSGTDMDRATARLEGLSSEESAGPASVGVVAELDKIRTVMTPGRPKTRLKVLIVNATGATATRSFDT
jgi:hypothetical protein